MGRSRPLLLVLAALVLNATATGGAWAAGRNNPVASRSVGTRGGLAREASRWSTQVVTLMSAGPGEVALDGSGSNSPFAVALTQAMSRPGMTVGELPSYVQAEVQRLTE